MIESFKTGGKVPKRVAWEIILAVHALVVKEKSLVYVTIPEGCTCDVVGDSEFSNSARRIMLMPPSAWCKCGDTADWHADWLF